MINILCTADKMSNRTDIDCPCPCMSVYVRLCPQCPADNMSGKGTRPYGEQRISNISLSIILSLSSIFFSFVILNLITRQSSKLIKKLGWFKLVFSYLLLLLFKVKNLASQ